MVIHSFLFLICHQYHHYGHHHCGDYGDYDHHGHHHNGDYGHHSHNEHLYHGKQYGLNQTKLNLHFLSSQSLLKGIIRFDKIKLL